jgi:hypothetical protein
LQKFRKKDKEGGGDNSIPKGDSLSLLIQIFFLEVLLLFWLCEFGQWMRKSAREIEV